MKKRLMILVMAVALVLSLPMAVSAAELGTATDPVATAVGEAGDNTRSVASSSIGATRNSATSGTVEAYALFSGTASKAVCQIFLQESYNGSWRTATGLTTTSYSKTVYNANSITAGKTFTLKSGKVYRAKIVFADTIGGTTYTKTRYTGSF
ncbi:MAG: hypothetical protein Q4F78_03645 [Bacillota bacterium]|nr:hypothetical protein [Bacillota bacterium]